MSFTRIITFVLIAFIIFLVTTSYLSKDVPIIDGIKDDASEKIDSTFENVKDNNFISKSSGTFDSLKERVLYGSFDRTIKSSVYFCPEDDCLEKIVSLINSSKKTIDCAVYDISLQTISEALVSKAEEGVEVRFVSDYGRSKTSSSNIGILKSSKVSVITNPLENPYMHNKFCVFDEKTVLVGSMNFTLNGNYKNNNNFLVLEDKELAKEYTKKIDSFFKGDFSLDVKEEVDVKRYGNIENYFCPEDNCAYHLLKSVDEIESSIDCMLFSFTLDDFFDIVKDKDINQRYILEARNIDSYSQYNNLKNNGVPVILDQNPNSMHNKFCVIDEHIVLTGSMNISRNGVERNDESFLIVYDPEVAKEYMDYFESYWDVWSAN